MNPRFTDQIFWSTGYQIAAIGSLSLIMLFCLWSIFSDKVRDGLFGRLFYAIAAFACFAGLYHMAEGTYPQRTTITIFVCIALLTTRRMMIHYFWDVTRSKYFFQLRRLRSQQKSNDKSV